jgi:hypothetical protein
MAAHTPTIAPLDQKPVCMAINPKGLEQKSINEYIGKSINQMVKGNYTDDVTALGTVGQVVTGLFGADLPGDIRDIAYDVTHWENSWGHFGQTLLDTASLLPGIGALKSIDEIAALAKNGAKQIDGASSLSKKAPVVSEGPKTTSEPTTTVYRVQGGTPPNASKRLIEIDDDGNPLINKSTLNVSMGDMEHAKHFQKARPGSEIVSFDIPKWMDDFVQEEAIPQLNYKKNPLNQGGLAPKVVDPTTPGRSYELPSIWAEWLEETAIKGSGKVIK